MLILFLGQKEFEITRQTADVDIFKEVEMEFL